MYTRTAVAVTPARRGWARSPDATGLHALAEVTVAMSAPVDPAPDVRSSPATPAGSARPRTLPALFEASVERFAPSVLVGEKCEGTWQDTTFADMRTLVHRCAAGLMDLGLAKGDRVALISEGRREWPVAELGILYARAINSADLGAARGAPRAPLPPLPRRLPDARRLGDPGPEGADRRGRPPRLRDAHLLRRPRRDGREERWLLTEQNWFINSTMKMVRGRIEEA